MAESQKWIINKVYVLLDIKKKITFYLNFNKMALCNITPVDWYRFVQTLLQRYKSIL